MPVLVKLAPNPAFKPTDETKDAFDYAKRKGVFQIDYVTAMENIENSNGMYQIVAESAEAPAASVPRRLEDMTLDELKIMMLSLGIKTEKKMARKDVEALVRSRMAEVEITDE